MTWPAQATLISAAGITEAGDQGLSAALFAAGFVTLGVWIALETNAHLRHNRKDNDHGQDSEQ